MTSILNKMQQCTSRQLANLGSLVKSRHGAVMPIVGLASMAIFGAAGIAVDMGRVQIVNSRLQNSIDAAGLAAGSVISTEDPEAVVNKYFNANYPSGYMGATINPLVTTPLDENTRLRVQATGTVPTTFMKLFGIPSVAVSASTEITIAQKGLELVLVIDVTGSMTSSSGVSGVTKLQAAKDASKQLLNVLYGADNTNEGLWVGLVPFSQAVNIGNTRTTWVSGDTFNYGPTGWYGCVDAREAAGNDVTDITPLLAPFPRYFWPCDGNNGWYGTNTSRTNCATTSGWAYKSGAGPGTHGPNKYCPTPITPLVAEKSTVFTAIDALQARGNTHVVLGAAWAWRLLSPNWRGLWGGQMDANNLPLAYDEPLMSKAVVLLTDGDNTMSNGSRGAYWYLSNGKLGTTNQTVAETVMNTRTANVCNSMDSNGIIIYTIALGTSFTAESRAMLQGCASKPEFYFEAPSTATLSTIFKKIGDSLANLRISQ
jgi:Flp pilus assembly protein TadG